MVILRRFSDAVYLASELLLMLKVVAELVTVSDPQKNLFQGGNRNTVAFDAELVQPLIEINEELFEARGVFNWYLECDLG